MAPKQPGRRESTSAFGGSRTRSGSTATPKGRCCRERGARRGFSGRRAIYHYVAAPQTTSWFWAPVRRHGLEAPGVHGLLLAGSTIESNAGIVDVGAWAGLAAARRALELLGGELDVRSEEVK